MDTEGTETRRTRSLFLHLLVRYMRTCSEFIPENLRVLRVSVPSVFFPANPERSHPR